MYVSDNNIPYKFYKILKSESSKLKSCIDSHQYRL